MLNSLDEAIKQLLIKKGEIDTGAIDIAFETPNREWSGSRSKPTINMYLYDVRENHLLRGTEWVINKDENGYATKKKNPSRIDVSYLVTVWTSSIMDEHHLLWHVLAVLFHFKELPVEILPENLRQLANPIKTKIAQPDGVLNNPADFWSALSNDIKPSLNYVVTVPLDDNLEFIAPITRSRTMEFKSPDTKPESWVKEN
jgi:hypothetical protein